MNASMEENQQVLIDTLPEGKLVAENFRLETVPVPVAGDDEVLVKTIALLNLSRGAGRIAGQCELCGRTARGQGDVWRRRGRSDRQWVCRRASWQPGRGTDRLAAILSSQGR